MIFLRRLIDRIASRLRHLAWRLEDQLAVRRARQLASADGLDPDEVVGIGAPTMMVGDLLTDGPEFPLWFFYEPKRAARHGLTPMGGELAAARMAI